MEEDKPPENRNINTGGGNYNERIEGDYIQGNVFQNIFNILAGQTTTPVGNPARSKNERILLAAVKEEVTARLRQSLHKAVLINLGKESQQEQVKRSWDAEIKIGLKPSEPLPDTTTILEVFNSEEIASKLLILGNPGSGKTTTQLELAQALVCRAEEQPDYPVPVLFNLSLWKDDRQSITDWLVVELKSKYGISKKLGQQWVENHQLLPLLDGLDELEPQRQEICVREINKFLASENRPLYLVVCSRSEEYSNYSTQLQLNGAIYLQPLSKNQICDYLTSINSIELWSIISRDLDILELVKTPLLLSITVLAYQEISVEEWQHLTSTADRIQYLLNTYIERMLTRDINCRAYLKKKPPNVRQTRMWLVWLAQQMLIEAKTEFFIEEMQPTWLSRRLNKYFYTLVVGLVLGLIGGLLIGLTILLTIGAILGLVNGIVVSTFISLFFGINFSIWGWLTVGREMKIEPVTTLNTSFLNLSKSLLGALIAGLITWQLSGMIVFLIVGLVIGIVFGASNSAVEEAKFPNQGIWQSLKNAGLIALLGSVVMGALAILMRRQISSLIISPDSKTLPLVPLMLSGVLLGLFFGLTQAGMAGIQHLSLRIVLKLNGDIPCNYARFLNYCTERLILQRVGGRYRFIHKLLQDHFAQMPLK